MGRSSEVVNLCHAAHVGTWTRRLASPLGAQSLYLESPWLPTQASTKMLIAITIMVCLTVTTLRRPGGGAAAHG